MHQAANNMYNKKNNELKNWD